jgi:hypothetical protein
MLQWKVFSVPEETCLYSRGELSAFQRRVVCVPEDICLFSRGDFSVFQGRVVCVSEESCLCSRGELCLCSRAELSVFHGSIFEISLYVSGVTTGRKRCRPLILLTVYASLIILKAKSPVQQGFPLGIPVSWSGCVVDERGYAVCM